MSTKHYSMRSVVTSFDVGPSRKLKYSMILRFLQEVAGRQLEEKGLSYEFLRDKGMAFLLTRASVAVRRLPSVGEELEMETWFQGLRGAQFIRLFRIYGSGRELLTEAESSWIIVEPENHRILRPKAFPYFDRMPAEPDDRFEIRTAKQAANAKSAFSGGRIVRWSDIDCNGHMNNAVYADLICDFYPGGFLGREFSSFFIAFQGEAKENEEIWIQTQTSPEGEVFYTGKIGEKRCFEAGAELKP